MIHEEKSLKVKTKKVLNSKTKLKISQLTAFFK